MHGAPQAHELRGILRPCTWSAESLVRVQATGGPLRAELQREASDAAAIPALTSHLGPPALVCALYSSFLIIYEQGPPRR